jgi:DnaK suppressor protein
MLLEALTCFPIALLRTPETMLTQQERDTVERLLLQERERALEALGDFDEQSADTLEEDSGELSAYRFHLADIGTEAMEREKQFLLASKEGERLYRIDEALRRLYTDPEGFGRCERCGADIGMERLEVVPEATLCSSCQRELEG